MGQASLGLQPPDKTTKVLLTNDTSIRFFTDNCHHNYCDDTLCWADKEIHETDLTHFRQQILPPPPPPILLCTPDQRLANKDCIIARINGILSIDILTILKTIPFCTNKRFLS